MPSMRCLQTAGPALERDNIAGYNCAFRAIDDVRAFDEILYILTRGTGVGFSVERQFIHKLPEVAEEFHETNTTICVGDSAVGWASSFKELISLLYSGQVPKVDYSKIRPKGSPLKTFGGRASGPEPLKALFEFCVEVFRNAAGRKLSSIECHDIVCKIGECIVVGGVRRSALLSISNIYDDVMRDAKTGEWWKHNNQRRLANNSACYLETPTMGVFMKEWKSLYDSKSGERGIFSRKAAQRQAERTGRRDPNHDFGINPCAEIILRNKQFCNLSEVVIRPNDSFDDVKKKVRIATIMGTMQATLTNFKYLTRKWKENTEEEALLGVSLTGIMDNPLFGKRSEERNQALRELREYAVKINKEWAKKLGINQSASVTTVKPSGTVSQLVGSSSGIHPRMSKYYIRRVRIDKKDPIVAFLRDSGIEVEDEIGNNEGVVVSFPMKYDCDMPTAREVSAIDQLETWKDYQDHWCEHKPSCTVYVKESEWMEVGAWIYKNFNDVSGISFLPYDDHVYKQAPYEVISKERYEELASRQPELDFSKLSQYETEDNTAPNAELACTGNRCEI